VTEEKANRALWLSQIKFLRLDRSTGGPSRNTPPDSFGRGLVLRFLDRGDVIAFERLDVLGIIGLHAFEDDERAVLPTDLRFEHAEGAAKVELGDLVDE
jgi:hypothetical protein